MPSEDIGKTDTTAQQTSVRRRRKSSQRVLIASTLVAVLVLLLAVLSVVIYRTGTFDQYVKTRFVERMAEMNVVFDAEAFTLTLAPLELNLRNATFKDRVTGQDLFWVREAHLQMTVQDLYALQASRDITIDKTDISGAEVWIKFDKNGNSNFSNLKLVEQEKGAAVNFRYESVVFSLQDSIVHFGDVSRKISGEGRNMAFLLSPAGITTTDGRIRYNFDLTAADSSFAYDQSTLDKIGLRAVGLADNTGADISRFDLKSPIG